MKKTILALSLAALSLPALAQDKKPEPEYTFTGNFGVTSDYRFRGISQSNNKPAIQGGVDFAHKSGFYLGNWNSSVSSWASPYGAGIEMDFYGGFKTEVFGVGLDLGAIYYYYPGAEAGSYSAKPKENIYNTQEAYVGLSYGPISFKTSYLLSKNYFGIGKAFAVAQNPTGLSQTKDVRGTLYYDLSFALEIAPKVTLKAHAGLLDVRNATSWGVKDYSLGLSYALPDNWSVSLAAINSSIEKNVKDTEWFTYLDANDVSKKLYGSKVAVSISKTF